jgi:hypothetical protein
VQKLVDCRELRVVEVMYILPHQVILISWPI